MDHFSKRWLIIAFLFYFLSEAISAAESLSSDTKSAVHLEVDANSRNRIKRSYSHCSYPYAPYNLRLDTPTEVSHSGRMRWSCVFRWSVPRHNCHYLRSSNPYEVSFGINNTTWVGASYTTFTVYADGNQSIYFCVKAYNDYNRGSSATCLSSRTSLLPPQLRPANVQLELLTSRCVHLSWEPPAYPNGELTYLYTCNNNGWHSVIGSFRNMTICGVPPTNHQITCRMKANNDAGLSQEAVSNTVQLECTAPTPPQNLRHALPQAVLNSGRTRWRYDFSWNPPANINCQSLHANETYEVGIGTFGVPTAWTAQTDQTLVVFRDGDESFAVVVRVKNSDDLSSDAIYMAVNTEILPPQIRPRNVILTASSPYCVQLSWEPPEYLNGEISAYQYKFNDDQWRSTPGTTRNLEQCGFNPYQQVTVNIRAVNSVGSSQEATPPAVRTHCANPEFPDDLRQYINESKHYSLSYEQNRKKLRISIPSEDITANCANISSSSITWNINGSETSADNGGSFYELAALTVYQLTVVAENNDGLTGSASVSFTTGELEPYGAPVIRGSSSFVQGCVFVCFEKPEQPNGIVINFQFKCFSTNAEDADWIDYAPRITNVVGSCGHYSGANVTCYLQAATSEGYGPQSDVTITAL